MDHLHFADVNQADPLEAYVDFDQPKYDGGAFDTYLERLGISEEQFFKDAFIESDVGGIDVVSSVDSLLQEWLFFGLLAEFCLAFDVPFNRADFLSVSKKDFVIMITATEGDFDSAQVTDAGQVGHTILSTKALLSLVERIIRRNSNVEMQLTSASIAARAMSNLFKNTKWATFRTFQGTITIPENQAPREMDVVAVRSLVAKCIAKSLSILERLWALYMKHLDRRPRWSMSTWVVLRVLAETLVEITNLALGEPLIRPPAVPHLRGFWRFQCLKNGQCPRRVSVFCDDSIATSYFVTSLQDGRGHDHRLCSHAECAVSSYPDLQAVTHTDKTHRSDCDQTCISIEVAGQALVDVDRILSRDDRTSFPVILPGRPANHVDWSLDKMPYLAVSHVWSHGLGNPSNNSITSCQYLHIRHLQRKLPVTTIGIWIDTLCVPLGGPGRRRAITKMRDTYSNASAVLVVDEELLKVGLNPTERYVRAMMSDWMTRLWTLQEGMLAMERLYFAFADGVTSISEVRHNHFIVSDLALRIVPINLNNHLFESFGTDPRSFEDRLMMLIPSLSKRTTTKKEDEAICLATLAGVDLSELPERPCLADVFSLMISLPQDILFAPGPRSTKPGFRWSPLSLLDRTQRSYNPNQKQAWLIGPCGPGLMVTKQALRFTLPITFHGNSHMTPLSLTPRIRVRDFDGQDMMVIVHRNRTGSHPLHRNIELGPVVLQHAALIFEDYSSNSSNNVAALVYNVRENAVRTASYLIDVVAVLPADGAIPAVNTEDLDATIFDAIGYLEGVETWCID